MIKETTQGGTTGTICHLFINWRLSVSDLLCPSYTCCFSPFGPSSTFLDHFFFFCNGFFVQTLILPLLITLKAAHRVQDCVVGNTLNISLDSLSKDSVSLYFTNRKVNGTLVERGSLADNLPDLFKERIQITSSDIQVLKTDESDMGNYTLIDGEGRTVKVITPNFVREFPHLKSFHQCR